MDRALNWAVFLVCIFLLLFCGWLSYRIVLEQRASDEYVDYYMSWLRSAQDLHNASEYLTYQVRQYSLSLNPTNARNYLEEVYRNKSRENSLKILYDSRTKKPAGSQYLVEALDNSVILAKKEQYAMLLLANVGEDDSSLLRELTKNAHLTSADAALDREGRLKRARELLFDNAYNQEQRGIIEPIHRFTEAINEAMFAKRREYAQNIATLAMELQIGLALLFVCSIFFIARLQTRQVHF